jgi:hypothetical protein
MHPETTPPDTIISAVLKLDPGSGERQNVLSFLQSCYGCRVREYDFDAALESLRKLSPDEQHALTVHCMRQAA